MAECTRQYEILRRQTLQAEKTTNCHGLEQAFIERRGLAAWIAYVPPSASAVDWQPGETEKPDRDLILALAALVVGDGLEEQDDRTD